MVILGINEDHNATAALIKDGEVVACASEERFTRVKNDVGYPLKAVEFVLEEGGVKAAGCDHILYAGTKQDPMAFRLKRVTRFTVKDYIREMREYWKPVLLENRPSNFWKEIMDEPRFRSTDGLHYDFGFMKELPEKAWDDAFQQERRRLAAEHLGVPEEKIRFVDHHTAHAHYAYFAAPIDRSKSTAVVTADGWGDGCNASISIARGDDIKEIHRTALCNLARIYRWMTLLLNFKPYEHEYKVMGLAPYAKDYIRHPAYEIFKKTLVVDGIDFRWEKRPPDLYFYFKEEFEREGVRFDGIAGGLQQWAEEITAEWMTNILKKTGADQLVFSGGLSMNVKVNKVIAELPRVKDFFVAPSGGDESLAMGAAFIAANHTDDIPPLKNAYLGSAPDEKEVRFALGEYKACERFEVTKQPSPEQIADLLVQGNVIARCAGRMEFGARALGNRSILCDPSEWENVRKINEKIKFRDFWMPFTPTILSERANDYLINPKKLKSPYMTVTFASTQLARQHMKAAVHPYDFTIRPQILEEKDNPEYYAIIKAFEKKTGIGGVLNTSFNLHGMPIVRTASEALDTFARSGLDALLLPGVVIVKKKSSSKADFTRGGKGEHVKV
jgi:carbamoyltransferase